MSTQATPNSEPKALKYWMLVEHLRAYINHGERQPGDRVPSMMELRAEFGLSRATVEKAFDLLEQEGLVVREQGRGTFVAERVQAKPVAQVSNGIIGLLILSRNPSHPYDMHLLAGVRDEARQVGLEVVWLDKGDGVPWSKLDGVLMYFGNELPRGLSFPEGLPAVSVLRHVPNFDNVTADDFGGTELAVEHLIAMGHTRIACLYSSMDGSYAQRRTAGYLAAMERAGLQTDEDWRRTVIDFIPSDSLNNAEKSMRQWLKDDWFELGCTAILAANDVVAIGIIKALAERGLQVPRDVSVIGFDGVEASEYCIPRLTTVEVPLRDVGAEAMRVLWDKMQGREREAEDIVLPTRLKLGDSSAPPRKAR